MRDYAKQIIEMFDSEAEMRVEGGWQKHRDRAAGLLQRLIADTKKSERRKLHKKLSRVRTIIDIELGDSDFPEDDRPLVKACQILTDILNPTPKSRRMKGGGR